MRNDGSISRRRKRLSEETDAQKGERMVKEAILLTCRNCLHSGICKASLGCFKAFIWYLSEVAQREGRIVETRKLIEKKKDGE